MPVAIAGTRPIGALPIQFPKRCCRCGHVVRPGATPDSGFVFKERPLGPWIAEHDECPESDGIDDPYGMDDWYPIIHEDI